MVAVRIVNSDKNIFSVVLVALLALILFSLLFSGITFGFWVQFSLSISGLCLLAYKSDIIGMHGLFKAGRKDLVLAIVFGLLSASILYGAFFCFKLLAEYMFSFAHKDIANVYTLKGDVRDIYIALLLIFVIGPGEEIFWRGYLQRTLSKQFGFAGVIFGVAAYTVAHLASANLMLIAAAAVCGLFWALMFWRFKSIWLNIISHVVWDVAVFLIWPLY